MRVDSLKRKIGKLLVRWIYEKRIGTNNNLGPKGGQTTEVEILKMGANYEKVYTFLAKCLWEKEKCTLPKWTQGETENLNNLQPLKKYALRTSFSSLGL